MSTWTKIKTLSSEANCSVCSDLLDNIYWIERSSYDVYCYNITANSETKIIDSSAVFGFPYTFSYSTGLAFFKNNLYLSVAHYDSVLGRNIYNVYEYLGINTLGLMDSIGPHDVSYTFLDGNYYQLFSTGNVLVTYCSTDYKDAGYPKTTAEPWSRYSVDGLLWGDASFNIGTPSELDVFSPNYCPPAYYPKGIYGRFITEHTSLPNYKYSIYLFDSTMQWLLVKSDETHGYLQSDMTWDKHWTAQNTWSETTDDLGYNAYTTQGTTISHVINYNTPGTLGITRGGDVSVYYFLSGAWALLDGPITDGQFDYTACTFVELSNNDVYIVGYNGFSGDNEVWKRDDKLVPPAGVSDRLWIYKSTDGGNSWTSRGVMT